MEAVFLVWFTEEDSWVSWVLDAFGEESDRTIKKAESLWAKKGAAAFAIAVMPEGPSKEKGWAIPYEKFFK